MAGGDAGPWSRPLGHGASAVVTLVAFLAPIWLFWDPLTHYRLQTDDFAYAAASRTPQRTAANLLVPHNTHVVPAWRVLCLAVAGVGPLERLADGMVLVAYAGLVGTMGAVGFLVTLETGRRGWGLLALVAVGSTSIMEAAGTWFSAGQTLWASLGIVWTLIWAHTWARTGRRGPLLLTVPSAWLAGGMWSVGHIAGLAGCAYLSGVADPRRRQAAWVPLIGSLAAIGAGFLLKGHELATGVRVDGRTPGEAFSPARGVLYTLQAIPENLVFGNLGLNVTTTAVQGALLTLALIVVWLTGLRRAGRTPGPLERAGVALIALSYVAEYGIRGYKPFAELRGVAVPWYNTIPHVGFVLFLAGWARGSATAGGIRELTWRGALAALAFQAFLMGMNAPRVLGLWDANLAPMSVEDARRAYLEPGYRRERALRMAADWARRQRRDLSRLDRAEAEARRLGIGREAIRAAFGRVHVSELPEPYDAADMLGVAEDGPLRDPQQVRAALGRWLTPAAPNSLSPPSGSR